MSAVAAIEDLPLARPHSLGALFSAFNRMALQGFGGVLAVAQRELVERLRWLSRDEFVELLAVSQVLPGPNIVNLALLLGDRFFGVRGAFVALAGMLAVPLVIVIAMTAVYTEFAALPVVAGALRGMGAVAAGLVLSTALKLSTTLRTSRLGAVAGGGFAIATFVAVAWLRWPLLWVLGAAGSIAIALAWQRLAPPSPP